MPAARRIARFHEVQLHVLVGSWMVGAERSEHVRGKAAIAGAGFDQRERPAGRRELGHLGDLTGEKRAEDRKQSFHTNAPDISRAAKLLS